MIAARFVMSGMWLQDVDSISSGNSRLLMIFVGIVALSMLIQAIVLIIGAIMAAKARNRAMVIIEEIKHKAMPLFESSNGLIRELHPKLKVLTENLVDTSHVVRAKAHEFDATFTGVNQTIRNVNHKTQAQADRVDHMVTSILTTTAEIAGTIQNGIKVPVREVSGIVNGLKAGLDVLMGQAKGFGAYSTKTRRNNYRDEDIGI